MKWPGGFKGPLKRSVPIPMKRMLDNSLTVTYTDVRTIEDIPIELWERKDDCEVTNN